MRIMVDRCAGRSATARGSRMWRRLVEQRRRHDGDDREPDTTAADTTGGTDTSGTDTSSSIDTTSDEDVSLEGCTKLTELSVKFSAGDGSCLGRQRRPRPPGDREGLRGVRRRGAGGDPRCLQDRRGGVWDLRRRARGRRHVVRRRRPIPRRCKSSRRQRSSSTTRSSRPRPQRSRRGRRRTARGGKAARRGARVRTCSSSGAGTSLGSCKPAGWQRKRVRRRLASQLCSRHRRRQSRLFGCPPSWRARR